MIDDVSQSDAIMHNGYHPHNLSNSDCKRYVFFFFFIVKVHAVIGVLMDDTDPLVTVMKVEKAPQETYADIGGLDAQIQEIKV